MQEHVLVQSVAKQCEQLPVFVGFSPADLLAIVAQLASYLAQCQQSKHADKTPQQLVADKYRDGEYIAMFLGSISRRAHAAARSQGQKFRKDQSRALTITALDTIRTSELVLNVNS